MDEKEKGRSIEKRIRITDNVMNEQINRIMTLPGYRKSCNRVINEALFYGLPILCEKLFGEVKLSAEEPAPVPPTIRQSYGGLDEEILNVIVRLLRETVLNVTINKSILSSIFHDLERVNKALNLNSELYEQGLMSDTPDYLNDYEISGLKKLRR